MRVRNDQPVDDLIDVDGTFMTAKDANAHDRAVVGAWIKKWAPKAAIFAGGAGVVAIAASVGLAKLDDRDVVNQEGFVHDTPDPVHNAPKETITIQLTSPLEGYTFTDQFVCAAFGEPTVSNTDIVEHDLRTIDLQSPARVTEVILDPSLLTGHYADAVIGADLEEYDPIGVCLTSDRSRGGVNKLAAPLFQAI